MLSQTCKNVETSPERYLTLIYGEAGVGKTSFCQQIEEHYFLETEPGTKGIKSYGSSVPDWRTFVSVFTDLVAAVKGNFKDQRKISTIIVDSYDSLFDRAGEFVCETETFLDKGTAKKFSKISETPYYQGVKRTSELVLSYIQKLCLLGYGVILTSHCTERAFKWRGQDLERLSPSLYPSATEKVVSACDAVGYFCVDQKISKDAKTGELTAYEEGRYQYWQPSIVRVGKHRLAGFPEKLDLKLGEGWKEYRKAFEETCQKLR